MDLTRELGEYGINIGTSVALEEGFSQLETFPKTFWVNIRTLLRNTYGAISDNVGISDIALIEAMDEEMEGLEAAIVALSKEQTSVVFYHTSHATIDKQFPKAQLKKLKTPGQLQYRVIERSVCKKLLSQNTNIRQFDVAVRGDRSTAMILSHYPIDLLSHTYFDRLSLIESHTGAIKKKDKWNTKLTGGKQLTHMPFNSMTLQVYGDGATNFNTMPHRIKVTLNELAKEKRWHALTTKDKMLYDINTLTDKIAASFYKQLLAVSVR